MTANRRQFLSLSAFASASLTVPAPSWAGTLDRAASFNFIYPTDTHIQSELAAADGCAMCFKKIRSILKTDFAIQGGDHVFDALGVDRQRANSLYDQVEGKPDPKYTGLIIHDLRRSAVKNLINAGVPQKVAMAITGHKTDEVFKRCHIIDREDVVKAMKRVQTLAPNSSSLVQVGPKRRGKRLLKY